MPKGERMLLYHYFEKNTGPFYNLSDLNIEEAEKVLGEIRKNNQTFAAKRDDTYINRRFEYEQISRELFERKGGKITRNRPHYMTVEGCDWIKSWYVDGCEIHVDTRFIDMNTVSFTYGDMFPTFGPRGDDSTEYRKQVYTYSEIQHIIQRYGLPQQWNPTGDKGPIRYIEAQIWSDDTISQILKASWEPNNNNYQ